MAKLFQCLRGLMKENDFTQPQLARRLGIGATTLNQKLNGHTAWEFSEAYDILELFGIPAEEVFGTSHR